MPPPGRQAARSGMPARSWCRRLGHCARPHRGTLHCVTRHCNTLHHQHCSYQERGVGSPGPPPNKPIGFAGFDNLSTKFQHSFGPKLRLSAFGIACVAGRGVGAVEGWFAVGTHAQPLGDPKEGQERNTHPHARRSLAPCLGRWHGPPPRPAAVTGSEHRNTR